MKQSFSRFVRVCLWIGTLWTVAPPLHAQDLRDRVGSHIDTIERAYFSLLPDLTPFRIEGRFQSAEPIIDAQGNLILKVRTTDGKVSDVQFAPPTAQNLSLLILNFEYYARRQWELERLKLPPGLISPRLPRYEQDARQVFVTLNDGRQFYGQPLYVTRERDSVALWTDLEAYDFTKGTHMTIPVFPISMIRTVDYRRRLPFRYLLASVGVITGGIFSFMGDPILEGLGVEQTPVTSFASTAGLTLVGFGVGALLDLRYEYVSRRFTPVELPPRQLADTSTRAKKSSTKKAPRALSDKEVKAKAEKDKRREIARARVEAQRAQTKSNNRNRFIEELRRASMFDRLPPPEFDAGRRAWARP